MMISITKLIKMAKKWQRLAATRRKTISLPGTSGAINTTTMMTEKGHFVVYTTDNKRFAFPIEYLNTYIFRELLILSEEVFGLPGNRPITFPCDSVLMNYAINLIQRRATEDMEKALLMSIANQGCSLSHSLNRQKTCHELLPCIY